MTLGKSGLLPGIFATQGFAGQGSKRHKILKKSSHLSGFIAFDCTHGCRRYGTAHAVHDSAQTGSNHSRSDEGLHAASLRLLVGNVRRKWAPCDTSSMISNCPWCAATYSRAIARPKPLPLTCPSYAAAP